MNALFCVVLFITQDGINGQNHDFRPTPIPLSEWHQNSYRRESRAGTLHETFETESPPSVAAVPAHYWEDALRHSVYLTLVKDKIKQLMTKSDETSDSKPGNYDSKETEDQGLWDRIKNAPFKRLPEEDPAVGDVTIMAKGRLLEDKKGFSFAEDERSKETCDDDKCIQGVRAFWSVKRVRQRDHETSPGKYHYELTFSVTSQTPKKPKVVQENPIITYTVRENYPRRIVDKPQEYRKFQAPKIQTRRPERAIWFHKNIAPDKQIGRRQFFQGFDTLFSSLFSNENPNPNVYNTPAPKYKHNLYGAQPGYQNLKINYAGVHNDHHQIPYPYKPNLNLPIQPPAILPPLNPIQPYQDVGPFSAGNSNLYPLYPYDQRTDPRPPQIPKTTRPAVLPTPLPPISPLRDYSIEATQPISVENYDNATLLPDVKYPISYNKHKPSAYKVNYFSDHVRPPVYNAPPGVFVTMDKKPFKPMPPLKYLHPSKPNRPNRPIDFRPSPQVMDVQFSDTDAFGDTAFRPITGDYNNSTKIEFTSKKKETKNRKVSPHGKKQLKKHEISKSQHFSTIIPDIITAQTLTSGEVETLDWVNILGAFTKTTPMVSQTESVRVVQTTTPMSTTVATTRRVTSTTETTSSTSTTTQTAPKKRTRPPPKFTKQDKVKKHKRVTTTTSTTTNAPEDIKKKPVHDLTPQATSAATGIPTATTKIFKEPNNTQSSTTSSSTTTTSTTTKPTTTTASPTTTVIPRKITTTTEPRNKNRFRQSTLILKGTSVKHDRWNSSQRNQTTANLTSTTSSHRRKGSNFQGYMSSTPKMFDESKEKDHADRTSTTTTESSVPKVIETTSQINPSVEETVDQYETNSVVPFQASDEKYIIDETSIKPKDESQEDNKQLSSIKITSDGHAKNKTKCKKKKQNTTTEQPDASEIDFITESMTPQSTISRTGNIASASTIDEIINFNFDNDKQQNDKKKGDDDDDYDSYTKSGDEFEDIFSLLDGKQTLSDNDDHYDDDDEHDNDDDDDDEDDDTEFDDDVESDNKGPFSFLELISMS